MKSQSPDKLILGHLNINSIQFKFDGLKFIIGNKIDIFLISEIKLDNSFPTAQFLIEDFVTPCTRDRNSKGGWWLLLYIREDIPSKRLSCKTSYNIETLIVEINLKKGVWMDPTILTKTIYLYTDLPIKYCSWDWPFRLPFGHSCRI